MTSYTLPLTERDKTQRNIAYLSKTNKMNKFSLKKFISIKLSWTYYHLKEEALDSHYVEASFWRRLWTSRQTDYWM